LSRVRRAFFLEILRDRPRLWQRTIEQRVLEIRLSLTFAEDWHHEGDLLLEFLEDLVPLYHLSFTITPGSPELETSGSSGPISKIVRNA
jgi:hypothetical protein